MHANTTMHISGPSCKLWLGGWLAGWLGGWLCFEREKKGDEMIRLNFEGAGKYKVEACGQIPLKEVLLLMIKF